MSEVPDNLSYTNEHEWVNLQDDGNAKVGITDHAQDALSDVVFVELPHADGMVTCIRCVFVRRFPLDEKVMPAAFEFVHRGGCFHVRLCRV